MAPQAGRQEHSPRPDAQIIRFDRYQVDMRSGELRKEGRKIRLQPQPFQLLVLLLRNAGRIVSRDDIRRELWTEDTFVDFDHGLAAAVNKIREALGDSAAKPKFVETLPRRGYRFIGAITSPEKQAEPDNATTVAVGAFNTTRIWTRPLPGLILVIGILCAAVILSVAMIDRWRSKRSELPRLVSRPFTALPGEETSPAFSPDGSRIAFAWNGSPEGGAKGFDLYVKVIGGETQLRLTRHPSAWVNPAWSPDGTRIAFHRLAGNDTGIYVIPALGGPERKLTSTRIPYDVAAGISWSPDGKWIAFGNQSPNDPPEDHMFLVSVETLEVRALPHETSCWAEANPIFSHDGKTIFFNCVHNINSIEIYSIPTAGGASTIVLPPQRLITGFALSGDDSRIVFSHDFGQRLSVVTINDHSVRRIESPDQTFWPTISPNGDKLAYSAEFAAISIWRRDLSHPETPPMKFIPSTRPQNSPQYSPDGKHIAFESKRGGPWALWVSDADGGNLAQMSKDVWGSMAPRWSPDGKRIAFDTASTSPSAIYVVDIAEGVPRKLPADVDDIKLPSWSRDGKWIYFTSDVSRGRKSYRIPAEGGKAEALPSGVLGLRPAESEDGAYLYFASREVNFELEKMQLAGPNQEIQKEAIPRVVRWNLWELALGGIYFVPSDSPHSMKYFDLTSLRVKEMFRLDKDFDDGFSVSPDGRYLLYSQVDEANSDIMVMDRYR